MMFAIEVEYLLGRAVATKREERSQPEWPPHPQRLFSAMVAAFKENETAQYAGEDRAALLWLETLSAPEIAVSDHCVRTRCSVYVPVNDETTPTRQPKDISNALKALPSQRTRQERFFPTVVPDDPVVQFIWRDTDEQEFDAHREALSRLAAGVGYLGHSSSLVRVSVTTDLREASLVPVEHGASAEEQLRTVSSGRLQLLEDTHDRSVTTLRRMEAPDLPQTGYRVPRPIDGPLSVFGGASNWFVFERNAGKRLPLTSSLALTSSVRPAAASICDNAAAPMLLGHPKNTDTPIDQPHVAYVPLANVGHSHADGEIHGFAIVLPRDIDVAQRQIILNEIVNLQFVWNKNPDRKLAFDWSVRGVTGEVPKKTLHTRTWTRKSRCWATITPVVFGHFLHKLDDTRAFRVVANCCTAIGLPEPINVRISNTSMHEGVPGSNHFPSLSTRGKPVWTSFRNRKHTIPRKLPDGTAVRMRYHVAIEFSEAVYGPVILGAGRYFGMGLCRPLFG